MEHLVKNTYNEKLILEIQRIGQNTEKEMKSRMETLANKMVSIGIAIFSSITAGIIVNIFNSGKMSMGILVLIFLASLVVIFWISEKVLKKILKHSDNNKEKEETEVDIIEKFNTKIIQKVAEVDESVFTASNTGLEECKMLNIIVSLYNLNNILNYIEEHILSKKNSDIVRKNKSLVARKIYSKSLNSYSLEIVSFSLNIIDGNLNKLMNDCKLKKLKEYDLLKTDYEWVSKGIKKFDDYVKKI